MHPKSKGESMLLVSENDGVRTILFNRPHVHNAQNVELLREFDEVITRTSKDPDVRVVVLGGVGPSFCSGHDLTEMNRNREYADNARTAEGRFSQEQEIFSLPVQKFRRLPMPTICRVQGYCLAAGLMFAASADFCIAGESAVFGSPILRMMAVNDAEVPSLMFRVGERVAKEIIWLGRQLSAAEALSTGLISHVVPDDDLDESCDRMAASLLEAPTEALRLSKDVFQFMADRAGEQDLVKYHFMSHQFSHQTEESRLLLAQRVQRIAEGGSAVTRSEV